MIYDELIEELALTLLTKARYEGCISVIDGFSQCEEDKIRILWATLLITCAIVRKTIFLLPFPLKMRKSCMQR